MLETVGESVILLPLFHCHPFYLIVKLQIPSVNVYLWSNVVNTIQLKNRLMISFK